MHTSNMLRFDKRQTTVRPVQLYTALPTLSTLPLTATAVLPGYCNLQMQIA